MSSHRSGDTRSTGQGDGESSEGTEEPSTPTGKHAESDSDKTRKGRKKKGSFWKELPILIVVALVLVFLIQTFLARVYVIPSGSMEQTLHGHNGSGDRIIVGKLAYDFHDPHPGDVVVFKGPKGWAPSGFTVHETSNVFVHWIRQFGAAIGIGSPVEYDLVKRVIAVGGQTVHCCDARNRVVVDGKPLDEPYLYYQPGRTNIPVPDWPRDKPYPHAGEPGFQAYFPKVTVPQGYIFVMGDNRNNSEDSRYQNGGGSAGLVPIDNVIGKARFILWPPSRWQGISDYNPQQQAHALGTTVMTQGVPLGIATAAAFPVLLARGRRRRGRGTSSGRARGRLRR